MLSPDLSKELSKELSKKLRSKLSTIFSASSGFKRSSSTETLLGIDFGCERINAVALRALPAIAGQPAAYQLQAMARVATPSGAIVDHQLRNMAQVVAALKQLRHMLKVRTRNVATAVSGSSVTTKIVHVPNSLPVEMLAHHMEQEAAAHIPFPLAEISLDFEILGPSEQHPDRDKILLSAARTEHVQARVDALRQVGWRAQVVDIGSHALARAVCFLLAPPPEQRVAVLELSAESLTFMVISQGEIIYQRLQPLAADSQPATLSNQHYMAQVTSQAQRQLQLFCSNSGQTSPSPLLLCGSDTELAQLVPRLSHSLGIAVQLPDFSVMFGGEPHHYSEAPAFSTALGLALRRSSPCLI